MTARLKTQAAQPRRKSGGTSAAADHLIGLIKHQDANNLSWVRFFVALEGALFAALVLLNRYPTKDSATVIDPNLAMLSLPVFGILFALLFERIMVRERRWHAWYVQQFRIHSRDGAIVFPSDDRPARTRIDDLSAGRIGHHLTIAAFAVIGMWVAVAVALAESTWHASRWISGLLSP